MEIITGVERRRRWRCEEKLRIVAEVERPGASFADVARRHEVSRGLLWNWRRQVRAGVLAPEPMPVVARQSKPCRSDNQRHIHWWNISEAGSWLSSPKPPSAVA